MLRNPFGVRGTGPLQGSYATGQTFGGNLVYDTFGRVTEWSDGSSLAHRAEYEDHTKNFRLKRLKVYEPVNPNPDSPQNPTYMQLNYGSYDAAGNLLAITDPGSTYGNQPALNNTWAYTYDGVARLKTSKWSNDPIKSFGYDGMGNMTSGNDLSFEHENASRPHRMTAMEDGTAQSTPPLYDANGALYMMPATSETETRNVIYDPDGRVETVNSIESGHKVRSVYDFRGQRVARIVDEGLTTESITFYYGRWFEVTGATLTRHMYLGDKLIAESPIAAPASLSLAALAEAEHGTQLARVMTDAVRRNPMLYPTVYLRTETGAAVMGGTLLICVVLAFLPWQARLGYFGKVRRGRVGLVVVIFSLSLAPLHLRRAQAAGGGGGGPPAPSFPVYFLHTDHLGSTLALGCHKQTNGCADRQVYRYYRYSAYGQMKAYDSSGTLLPATQTPTVDRLYTGQVWDVRAQAYYYNARFYDPKAARFMTTDPAREQASPYAYVGWNPVAFVDPTGMVMGFSGVAGALNAQLAGPSIADLGWAAMLAWRGPGRGGFNGPNGGGPGGGAGQEGLVGGGSIAGQLEGLATQAIASLASGLAEDQGKPFGMTLGNPALESTPGSPPEGTFNAPSVEGISVRSFATSGVAQVGRAYATQMGGYVDASVTATISQKVGFVSGIYFTPTGFHTYHGFATPGLAGFSITMSGYQVGAGAQVAVSGFGPTFAGGQFGASWSAANLANFNAGAWQFFSEFGYGTPGFALSIVGISPLLSYDGPSR